MSLRSRSAGTPAVLWLVAILLGSSAHAFADTIQVTGGALTMIGTVGRLSITGTDGFSLVAGVDATAGIYAPFDCFVPVCGPGTAIDLRASWSDNDLPGTATLGGTTFPRLGDLNGVASATVQFGGFAIAPPLDAASRTIVTAPFVFDGFFVQPAGSSVGIVHDLAGTGVATIWMDRNMDGMTWRPSQVTYAFDSPGSVVPTPEPTPLVLVGTGLAFAFSRRLRRYAAATTWLGAVVRSWRR